MCESLRGSGRDVSVPSKNATTRIEQSESDNVLESIAVISGVKSVFETENQRVFTQMERHSSLVSILLQLEICAMAVLLTKGESLISAFTMMTKLTA